MDFSSQLLVVSREPVAAAAVCAVRALLATSERCPRLAIAGGSLSAAVGHLRRELGPDWRRMRLTWVDERCVPFDDEHSNRGSAYRTGALSSEDAPAVELPLFVDGESPDAAVQRVDKGLEKQFDGGLDVLLLGMGEDGHIASLFPGHPALRVPEWAVVVQDSPKPPAERITLTLPILCTARSTILLAAGATKRTAVERLLARDSRLPALALRNLTLVTDQEPATKPDC